MKYSAQDLLLADRLLSIAGQIKEREVLRLFPDGSELLSSDVFAKRNAWRKEQSRSEFILKAMAELEEVAAIVNP